MKTRIGSKHPEEVEFAIVYDLRCENVWRNAHRHRLMWGRLYVEIHDLDQDRTVLVFRRCSDRRWAGWEQVRKRWILDDLRDEQAA